MAVESNSNNSSHETPNWLNHFAVFDTETTGVDTSNSRLVTACIAFLNANGEVTQQHSWIADPGVEIPEAAAAVHGITTEIAQAQGSPAAEVISEIYEILQQIYDSGTPLVIYNAPFDLKIMKSELERHGIAPGLAPQNILDPLVIDKQADRYRKGKRTLSVTAEFYGVELGNAHDAAADAVAAGQIMLALTKKYPLPTNLAELFASQTVWFKEQAESFNAWLVKQGRTPNATTEWPL